MKPISFVTKLDKGITKKKIMGQFHSLMGIDANPLSKITANQIQENTVKFEQHNQLCFICRNARMVQHMKLINVVLYKNRNKDKNHMILSID
jgi:hypothetical protein